MLQKVNGDDQGFLEFEDVIYLNIHLNLNFNKKSPRKIKIKRSNINPLIKSKKILFSQKKSSIFIPIICIILDITTLLTNSDCRCRSHHE